MNLFKISALVIGVAALGLVMIYYCQKTNPKQPTRIIVDMSTGFTLNDGDSIWWQMPEYIQDSVVGYVGFGHSLPQDTIFGLKNFRPTVVIVGNDTMRYYGYDTIRYTICNQK